MIHGLGVTFLPLATLSLALAALSLASIDPVKEAASGETPEQITDAEATLTLARNMAASPGHRSEALALYSQLLTASPGEIWLVRERRNVAAKLARFDVVANDFALLEKSGRLSAEETLWYAGTLQKLGRSADALALIERHLGGTTDQTELIALYLDQALVAGDPSRAEKTLTLQAERRPRRVDFAIGSATLALRRDDPAAAEAALRPALAAHPENPRLLTLLGEAHLAQGRPRLALSDYRRAVAAAPADASLRRQAARVAEICHESSEADAFLRPILDSSATPEKMRAATALEARAMAAQRQGRHPEAIRSYAELRAAEPGNIAAAYGYASALRAGGRLIAARDVYREILRDDPRAAYARGSAREISDDLRNHLRGSYLFINEDSPGRMADISRNIFTLSDEFWIGDRLKLGLGSRTWIEQPEGVASPYVATGATASADYRLAAFWHVNLDYTYKNYATASLADTHAGGATLAFDPSTNLGLHASYQHEDALTNRYNFTQHTQTDTGRLSFESRPLRFLELSGGAFLRGYSDRNLQLGIDGGAGLVFLRDPGKLVAELRGRYLTTQRQSESEFTGNEETNVIHPYWTPRDYFRGSLGLNWEQSLRPDTAAGQNELGYRAGVQGSLDTDGNPAVAVTGGLRCEIVRNLLLDLGGTIERSSQWNGATASLSVVYGF